MNSVHTVTAETLQIQGTLKRLKLVQTCISTLRQMLKCKDNEEVVKLLAKRSETEVLQAIKSACRAKNESLNDPVFIGLGLMKLMQRLDVASQSLVQALFFVSLDHVVLVLEGEDFRSEPLEGITLAYYMICLLLKNHGDWLEEKLIKVQRDLVSVTLDIFDLCIRWRIKPSKHKEGLKGQICVVQWSSCRCIQEVFQNAKRTSPEALLEAVRTTVESPSAQRFYYFVCEEVCRGRKATCMREVVDLFGQTAVLVDQSSIHPACRRGILTLLSVLHRMPQFGGPLSDSKRHVAKPLKEYKCFGSSSNSAYLQVQPSHSMFVAQQGPLSPSIGREQLRRILLAKAMSEGSTVGETKSASSSSYNHSPSAVTLHSDLKRNIQLQTERDQVAMAATPGATESVDEPQPVDLRQDIRTGATLKLDAKQSYLSPRERGSGKVQRKRPFDAMR